MCRNKIALWVYRHHTKFWFTLFKIHEPIYIFKNALVKIICMNEIVNRNLKIQIFFAKTYALLSTCFVLMEKLWSNCENFWSNHGKWFFWLLFAYCYYLHHITYLFMNKFGMFLEKAWRGFCITYPLRVLGDTQV